MKGKRLLSYLITATMTFGILGGVGCLNTVKAKEVSEFKNSLKPIEKVKKRKPFVARPLVILMDFPDYKYTDLDKREKNFRINNFTGKETTPEFYSKLFFGDDFYKTSDGKKHITVNKFFKEESGGGYEFKGKIYGWYTAKHPAKYYGGSQENAAKLTREAIEDLVKNNPNLDLSQFDVEDKWDIDHDGNYNEPDGIIDTVVVIHAGLGDEWGGGSLGHDAIWPFRIGFSWYKNYDIDLNKHGEKLKQKNKNGEYPAYEFKDGKGKQWFSEDFTVFEQDLPVDLFDHEYGHVLGLPDLYGTDRKSYPPVENWSIMGGSYTGNPRGSQPVDYGAYCKQYLQKDFEKRHRDANWQNQKVIDLKDINANGLDVVLDQASLKGKNNDCIRINLPNHETVITKVENGKKCYFSGKGDNIENYMYSKDYLDLTNKKSAELSFNAWYNIDPYFDFASVMVQEEGSKKWVPVQGNITTTKLDDWIKKNEPKTEWVKRNPGFGISDVSKNVKGSDKNGWVKAKFDLSKFIGKKIKIAFRFRTDSNTPAEGIYIDDINVNADNKSILSDNAENTKDSKFTLKGFSLSDGIQRDNHYYLLSWRNSKNGLVDEGLKTINIGRKGLEYDPGLIVWHINERYLNKGRSDQNVLNHPGELGVGVVDADQNPVVYSYKKSGKHGPDQANYQMHDAAFSLRLGSPLDIEGKTKTDSYSIKDNDIFMNPVFNDSYDYSAKYNKNLGLLLDKYGLKFFVTDESFDRSTAKIHIAKFKNNNEVKNSSNDNLIKTVEVKNNKLVVKPLEDVAVKGYALVNDGNRDYKLTLTKDNNKDLVCNLQNGTNRNLNVKFIILEDEKGNAKAEYNSKYYGYGNPINTLNSSSLKKERLSGKDRFKTSIEISKKGFKSCDNVIIANGASFADAICASPFAKLKSAPILLCQKDSISKETLNEIKRLNAKNVIIIGKEGAVSKNVEESIKSIKGVSIKRIGGKDRFETSLMIAKQFKDVKNAVLASGVNYADALSISSIAGSKNMPILLANEDNINAGEINYLRNLNIKTLYLLGGDKVIGKNFESMFKNSKRIFGKDRYETNLKILKEFNDDINFSNVYFATGKDFADALSGSALASKDNSSIVLIGKSLNSNMISYLNSKCLNKVTMLGGENVVSESLANVLK